MGQTTIIITTETGAELPPERRAVVLDLLYKAGVIEPAVAPGVFPAGPNLQRHMGVQGSGVALIDQPELWAGPDFSVVCPACRTEVTGPWLEMLGTNPVGLETTLACPECSTVRTLPLYVMRDGAYAGFALEVQGVAGDVDLSRPFWAALEDALGLKLQLVSVHR